MVDRPRSLIQGDERITLESVHQAEAAGASSTWRGKKVESGKQTSKKIQRNEKVAMKERDKKVILTLFDGAGGLGMSLNELGKIDLSQQRIVSCENHKGARLVCDSTNRKEDGSPMIDHNWCQDVMDITEQKIVDLGDIILVAGGAPCGDYSRKRNLRQRNGKMPTTDQRSGFKGKTGILFKQMVKIWRWVKKHNPNCDYFIENVVFDDMEEWEYICAAFGEPTVVNSKYQSFTARRRAYWTSFRIPKKSMLYEARQWQEECHDADKECMSPGRTLVKDQLKDGQLLIRPLGASWKINREGKLVEDTSRPVYVKVEGQQKYDFLQVQEAELLMGWRKGCTGHTGSSNRNRLARIGAGWDLNVTKALLKFWVVKTHQTSKKCTVRYHPRVRTKFMSWKETPEKPRDNTVTSRQGKISIGKGPSKSMLLTYEHCHRALGHLSIMQMERACKYNVIEGLPKFNWDELQDKVCTSCDKGTQRMPDKCKQKPVEFKPIHPMQHIYADVAVITKSEAGEGMNYIVCFREAPGQLRGYYAIKSLGEAADKFGEFLKDHFPNVADRGAMEKHQLLVKPDGDLGAFGAEFANVGKDFGYQVSPSLPRTPDENQAEWAVNEVKRKATTLIEENCLPKTCFPLVLRYISQLACFSPSQSHKDFMSPYEFVTDGRKISLKELIPFGTFGWKPKTKEERTALSWRAKPVVFLGWESIYKRSGVWVMSLDSLVIQKAKMKQRNFRFGFYWKDFVYEETQKDKHRRAIENSISKIEQTQLLDFKETMRNLDKDVDVIPAVKTKPILKKKITKECDDSQKYKHGQHVKVFCLEGEDTGWYSGAIDTVDKDKVQVYYAEDDTFTEHDINDKKLTSEDGSIKFRINDAVTIVIDDDQLKGKIIEVKPKKVVVYLEDDTKIDCEHTDQCLRLDILKSTKSFMTSKLPQQQFKKQWAEQQRKAGKCNRLSKKKAQKYWRKHKVSYCDKFWRKMSGDEAETDATLAFNPNNRKAVFLVEKQKEEPSIPKGYKDIQFISDSGVRAKWYQAILEEHAKSESNGTFEWIPDEKLTELKRKGVPILRHVWVFKIKRDDNGHYTVYKARGCVDGSQQKHGFDYNETFAPTCREASFKALMSLSVAMDWDVTQLDVGSAFTNASLEEDVYMRCPQGIHDKPKVCKLLRALYGLKQAPRAWYLNFLATLKRDGWTRCATDACLFKKQDSTKQWMYLLVYVDDILVAGSDIGRSETEAYLKTNYNMTVAGRPKDFLGFEVNYVRKGEDPNGKGYCILHQTRYVNELLERFDATEYKTIHSPWDSEAKLCKADEAAEGEKLDFPYREFCGAVIYLRTRPDITYTVNKLCKWMQNPGEKMVLAAKRLLRYLKTYPDGGISFGVNRFESDQPAVEETMQKLFDDKSLYCATDSSYGDEVDHGYSTMGEMIVLNGGLLHQKSYEYKAKLPVKGDGAGLYTGSIMKSTVEAEYVALSNGASELVNFSQLLGFFGDTIDDVVDYGSKQEPLKTVVTDRDELNDRKSVVSPLSIFGDNDGSLRITRKREMTKLAKHIRAKFHHVRDLFEGGAIDPQYLNTKDQIADVLTKGLNPIDHLRMCRKFMFLPERRAKAEKEPASTDEVVHCLDNDNQPVTTEGLQRTVLYLQRRACCAV